MFPDNTGSKDLHITYKPHLLSAVDNVPSPFKDLDNICSNTNNYILYLSTKPF